MIVRQRVIGLAQDAMRWSLEGDILAGQGKRAVAELECAVIARRDPAIEGYVSRDQPHLAMIVERLSERLSLAQIRQDRVEDRPRLLGGADGQPLHRALEVSEEHRDLRALPCEGAAGGDDLRGQLRGSVSERCLGMPGGPRWDVPAERRAALPTGLRP